jgi:predicted small lipoprotein YifL
MLRQFAAALAVAAALIALGTLAACGIKGPLRPPPPSTPETAPAPPTNPEARPPLLPSEPPAALVPPEPAKKP